MAFNGSGVFVRLYNWAVDRDAAVKIRADRMDAEMTGMADGLTNCVTRDGQSPATANLPMGGFKHTGVADGSTRDQYLTLGQYVDGEVNWVAGGGTVDAITAALVPTVTALVDGMLVGVRATGANTITTPTLAVDATGAKTIVKQGGQALAAGDIRAVNHDLLFRYRAAGTVWELLNPVPPAAPAVPTAASTTEVLTGTDAAKFGTPDSIAALWEQGSDVASAGTISLGEGGYFNITGTTTITDIDFATDKAGRAAWCKFAGALTLTNGANLILPGAANIVTAAGDTARFISEGADAVRCVAYTRAAVAPGSGKFVQIVSSKDGAVATGSTTIPKDDTIPQNTEGDQYMSLAITPTKTTNKLVIEALLQLNNSAAIYTIAALFQDTTANALATVSEFIGAAAGEAPICLRHIMDAGTLSATTFKIRAGPNTAATLTFNGQSGARQFGGVSGSIITISEIEP